MILVEGIEVFIFDSFHQGNNIVKQIPFPHIQ